MNFYMLKAANEVYYFGSWDSARKEWNKETGNIKDPGPDPAVAFRHGYPISHERAWDVVTLSRCYMNP